MSLLAVSFNLLRCCCSMMGLLAVISFSAVVTAAPDELEKENLRLGFIKLTDMAPLAIALEKGFFEAEGLYVSLEAQTNWKVLQNSVIDGTLDGAQMLAGQPLGAAAGVGMQADIITAFSMGLNGNAITLSNSVWQQMKPHIPLQQAGKIRRPVSAQALKPVVESFRRQGKAFNMAMVFPLSTHNYKLRYWLAAGGIHPGYYAPHNDDSSGQLDAEVMLSVTPSPQMPAAMAAGTIAGYCVGEPWNQQAVFMGVGVPVISDDEIWKNSPEKVFAVSQQWADKYPNTHIALVKALIRAAHWLDAKNNANRPEAVEILAQPYYVGADYQVIANSMTGTFEYEKGDSREAADFNLFFRHHATYPYYSDAVWFLTQMRRWGQIPHAKSDNWYSDIAKKVYRPDIYEIAARELIAEGKLAVTDFPDFATESGFKPPQNAFIDGIEYDGTAPNAYLEKFVIGLKGDAQID